MYLSKCFGCELQSLEDISCRKVCFLFNNGTTLRSLLVLKATKMHILKLDSNVLIHVGTIFPLLTYCIIVTSLVQEACVNDEVSTVEL